MKKYENSKWAERLNYLAEIEDGWYDGYGIAPNIQVLDKADEILRTLNSNKFVRPAMFPLMNEEDEGGISMEWSHQQEPGLSPHQVSFEISNSFKYEVFAFEFKASDDHCIETNSFEEAFEFLHLHLSRKGFTE